MPVIVQIFLIICISVVALALLDTIDKWHKRKNENKENEKRKEDK